jgi:hypothetical protein
MKALCDNDVCILSSRVSFASLIALTERQAENFSIISRYIITSNHVRDDNLLLFTSPYITRYLTSGQDVRALNALSAKQQLVLANANISALMLKRKVQFNDFLNWSDMELETLLDNQDHAQRLNTLLPYQDKINYNQSVHNEAVNKSVIKCVGLLQGRYGQYLQNPDFMPQQILALHEEIESAVPLTEIHALQIAAAKRCVSRLTDGEISLFRERYTQLYLRELLVLIRCAIEDDDFCKTEEVKRTARESLIFILYKIQRGGNIDDHTDVDDLAPDLFICATGSFNKLAESLVGIHEDYSITFVSPTIISYKIISVIVGATKQYLKNKLLQITNEGELNEVEQLIEHFKTDQFVPTVVWDEIKQEVISTIFAEFHEFYRNNSKHPDFLALIDVSYEACIFDYNKHIAGQDDNDLLTTFHRVAEQIRSNRDNSEDDLHRRKSCR